MGGTIQPAVGMELPVCSLAPQAGQCPRCLPLSSMQRNLCGHRKSPSTLTLRDVQPTVRRLERQWVRAEFASVRGSLLSFQSLLMDFGVSPLNSQKLADESHPEMLRGNNQQIPSHHSISHFRLGVSRLDEAVEWLLREANPIATI